jgi:CDP-glucose 4,6-dehydratase
MNPDFWRGKRVLVTGHTGFKGSWLCLWLRRLGAQVHGYSLEAPTQPNLFAVARVAGEVESTHGDVRDWPSLQRCMSSSGAQVVFHMAAQPLVRQSYRDPVSTYAVNVMGSVHVLEAARHCDEVRCVVNVTTDKCYENVGAQDGYDEDAALGGHDPYSSSKGCSELVTSAYRRSFLQARGVHVASARAGNVVGGGDWAADRLVPDVLKALAGGEAVWLRNPDATRPWQHVLEPLSGYLTLAQHLWGDGGAAFAQAWNFGPRGRDVRPVRWVVEALARAWGAPGSGWRLQEGSHPHEAAELRLDISKAARQLGWAPRWTIESALEQCVIWHRAYLAGEDMQARCLQQIDDYERSACLETT